MKGRLRAWRRILGGSEAGLNQPSLFELWHGTQEVAEEAEE
jgi:hypothetical protein